METKKLLKFLLKDLGELEELVTEKRGSNFDEFETEFIQTRVGGAKRMIQILHDRENSVQVGQQNKPEASFQSKENINAPIIEKKKVEERKEFLEEKQEIVAIEEKPAEKKEIVYQEEVPVVKTETKVSSKVEIEEKKEHVPAEEKEEIVTKEGKPEIKEDIKEQIVTEKQVELEEEVEEKDLANKRLGDSFSKEKSVNDLVNVDNTKLEHKLSNRPLKSIKSSIGINDRFQYIRELFNGNSDAFSEAVAELDKKKNIQEAVTYLQQNFKWKKNATSLKFVNLVKRRFSNE